MSKGRLAKLMAAERKAHKVATTAAALASAAVMPADDELIALCQRTLAKCGLRTPSYDEVLAIFDKHHPEERKTWATLLRKQAAEGAKP